MRRLLPLVLLLAACQDSPLAPTEPSLAKGGKKGKPVTEAPAPAPAGALYVEPVTDASKQAALWRDSRPADAAKMDYIASASQAKWFGNWNPDIYDAIKRYVDAAHLAQSTPVLVLYNIPGRDCGLYSAGGAGGTEEYQLWIRSASAAIAGRVSIVILEPDALAGMDCLAEGDRSIRLSLLLDALSVLRTGGVRVYLDAGNPGWRSAAVMADRLRATGSPDFALNVSNFYPTEEVIRYGQEISAQAGGRFVVDTSRNGAGSDGTWCNPPGRLLGAKPQPSPGPALVDAYLWIKRPGQSDGTCNGGPSAGTWWADYALGLARYSL